MKTRKIKILKSNNITNPNAPVLENFSGHEGEIIKAEIKSCQFQGKFETCCECGHKYLKNPEDNCVKCLGLYKFPWSNSFNCPGIGGEYLVEVIKDE